MEAKLEFYMHSRVQLPWRQIPEILLPPKSQPFFGQVLLHAYRHPRAFPGGAPQLACGFADTPGS